MPVFRPLGQIASLCALLTLAGCSDKLPMATVSGKVTYQDKPLTFGSVLYQPDSGPPATGLIQSDGTYRLATYGKNDGAVLGSHRVQVVAVDTNDPTLKQANPDQERPSGRSVIPEHYTNYVTSEIRKEVVKNPEPNAYDIRLE
jgi:hypothetical protein